MAHGACRSWLFVADLWYRRRVVEVNLIVAKMIRQTLAIRNIPQYHSSAGQGEELLSNMRRTTRIGSVSVFFAC
jgi:hypothetical protein